MIGFPNRLDAGVLSGGSWMPTLPLNMLQTRVLGEVARSTNLALASTQFSLDLGRSRRVQLLSWRFHNLSICGKFRARAFQDAAHMTPIYDSGWQPVWKVIYGLNSLEWNHESWWGRKYTSEQRQRYVPELIHIMPAAKYTRYWLIEFDDSANPAGYIQIGRMFIGDAWQPTTNMSYEGTSLGWETGTEVQKALSGAKFFNRQFPVRVQKLALNMLDEDEVFSNAFEIQGQGGIDQEVLWIHDPDDTIHAIKRQFLAHMRTLSAIEYPIHSRNNVGFELEELI
jgi:hypothetical protein